MQTMTESAKGPGSAHSLSQLVGSVYAAAARADRSRMREFLIRPLGALALVAVANGIFASIRFGRSWSDPQVALDSAERIQPGDIAQLVERLQLLGNDAIDGLSTIVTGSPEIAGSAAATLLVALLLQRRNARVAARNVSQLDPDLDPSE